MRCRPSVRFRVSAVDALALPSFPLRPWLAVSLGTGSETRAPPRSQPSSRRRRSPTWSAPPPKRSLLSAPVDTLALSPSPSSLGSLGGNSIGDEGASALAAVLKETNITKIRCAAPPVFAFVSAPVDTLALPSFPLRPSLTVSLGTRSETRAPPRSQPSSRRRRSPC